MRRSLQKIIQITRRMGAVQSAVNKAGEEIRNGINKATVAVVQEAAKVVPVPIPFMAEDQQAWARQMRSHGDNAKASQDLQLENAEKEIRRTPNISLDAQRRTIPVQGTISARAIKDAKDSAEYSIRFDFSNTDNIEQQFRIDGNLNVQFDRRGRCAPQFKNDPKGGLTENTTQVTVIQDRPSVCLQSKNEIDRIRNIYRTGSLDELDTVDNLMTKAVANQNSRECNKFQDNQANQMNCSTILPESIFKVFPQPIRRQVNQQIQNRRIRISELQKRPTNNITQYYYNDKFPIDLREKKTQDDLANKFYSFTKGLQILTQIFDAYSVGDYILDLRVSQKQVSGPPSARVIRDIVGEQIRVQFDDIGKGLFVTGYSLGVDATLSFNLGQTGGLEVPSGDDPGNVNYAPETDLSQIPIPPIQIVKDPSPPEIKDRILSPFREYQNAQQGDLSGLMKEEWGDLQNGELIITEITSGAKVDDLTQYFTWKEEIRDTENNNALLRSFDRVGQFPFRQEFERYSDDLDETNKERMLKKIQVNLDMSGILLDLSGASNRNFAVQNNLFRQIVSVPDSVPMTTFNPPLPFTNPPRTLQNLENGSGSCPVVNCSDPKVIRSLVDQQNADLSGSPAIVNVLNSFTINPNKCQQEVLFDAQTKRDKNGKIFSSLTNPLQKSQKATITMDVGLNLNTCEQTLYSSPWEANPSYFEKEKTSSSQDFLNERVTEVKDTIQNKITKPLSSSLNKTDTSLRDIIRKTRVNISASLGEIEPFDQTCPDVKCNSPQLLNKLFPEKSNLFRIGDYFPSKILRMGVPTKNVCDYTVEMRRYIQNYNTSKQEPSDLASTSAFRVTQAREGTCDNQKPRNIQTVPPVPDYRTALDFSNNSVFTISEKGGKDVNQSLAEQNIIPDIDCTSRSIIQQMAKESCYTQPTILQNIKKQDQNKCIADVTYTDNSEQEYGYTTGRWIPKTKTQTKPLIYTFADVTTDGGGKLVPKRCNQTAYTRESWGWYRKQEESYDTTGFPVDASGNFIPFVKGAPKNITNRFDISGGLVGRQDSKCPAPDFLNATQLAKLRLTPAMIQSVAPLTKSSCEYQLKLSAVNNPTFQNLHKTADFITTSSNCDVIPFDISSSILSKSKFSYLNDTPSMEELNEIRKSFDKVQGTAEATSRIGTIYAIGRDETMYQVLASIETVNPEGDLQKLYEENQEGPAIFTCNLFLINSKLTVTNIFINPEMKELPKEASLFTKPGFMDPTRKTLTSPPSIQRFKQIALTILKASGKNTNAQITNLNFMKNGAQVPLTVTDSTASLLLQEAVSFAKPPTTLNLEKGKRQIIELTKVVPDLSLFDSYFMVMGADADQFPLQWKLEVSIQGLQWNPIHTVNTDISTSRLLLRPTYLQSFTPSIAPKQIPPLDQSQKTFAECKRSPTDQLVLQSITRAFTEQQKALPTGQVAQMKSIQTYTFDLSESVMKVVFQSDITNRNLIKEGPSGLATITFRPSTECNTTVDTMTFDINTKSLVKGIPYTITNRMENDPMPLGWGGQAPFLNEQTEIQGAQVGINGDSILIRPYTGTPEGAAYFTSTTNAAKFFERQPAKDLQNESASFRMFRMLTPSVQVSLGQEKSSIQILSNERKNYMKQVRFTPLSTRGNTPNYSISKLILQNQTTPILMEDMIVSMEGMPSSEELQSLSQLNPMLQVNTNRQNSTELMNQALENRTTFQQTLTTAQESLQSFITSNKLNDYISKNVQVPALDRMINLEKSQTQFFEEYAFTRSTPPPYSKTELPAIIKTWQAQMKRDETYGIYTAGETQDRSKERQNPYFYANHSNSLLWWNYTMQKHISLIAGFAFDNQAGGALGILRIPAEMKQQGVFPNPQGLDLQIGFADRNNFDWVTTSWGTESQVVKRNSTKRDPQAIEFSNAFIAFIKVNNTQYPVQQYAYFSGYPPLEKLPSGSTPAVKGQFPMELSPPSLAQKNQLGQLNLVTIAEIDLSGVNTTLQTLEGVRDKLVPIVIEQPSLVFSDSQIIATGNDSTQFDPIRWKLEGSIDGESWTLLHEQSTPYSTPTARFTASEKMFQDSSKPQVPQTLPDLQDFQECKFTCDNEAVIKSSLEIINSEQSQVINLDHQPNVNFFQSSTVYGQQWSSSQNQTVPLQKFFSRDWSTLNYLTANPPYIQIESPPVEGAFLIQANREISSSLIHAQSPFLLPPLVEGVIVQLGKGSFTTETLPNYLLTVLQNTQQVRGDPAQLSTSSLVKNPIEFTSVSQDAGKRLIFRAKRPFNLWVPPTLSRLLGFNPRTYSVQSITGDQYVTASTKLGNLMRVSNLKEIPQGTAANSQNITSYSQNSDTNECIQTMDDSSKAEYPQSSVSVKFNSAAVKCEDVIKKGKVTTYPTKLDISTKALSMGWNTFQQVRFRPLRLRGGGSSTRLGKIEFFRNEKRISLTDPQVQVTNPAGTDNGTASSAIDFIKDPQQDWVDNSLGALWIRLPNKGVGVEIDGFTWITSTTEPERDPIRWILEGSTNGIVWQMLHDQSQMDATVPTGRSETNPLFQFDSKKAPKPILNSMKRSLEYCEMDCATPSVLEPTVDALAALDPPEILNPTAMEYTGDSNNSCRFVQKADGSIVQVSQKKTPFCTIETDTTELKVSGPAPTKAFPTGVLRGVEDCQIVPTDQGVVDRLSLFFQNRVSARQDAIPGNIWNRPDAVLNATGQGVSDDYNSVLYSLEDYYTDPLLNKKTVGLQQKKSTKCENVQPLDLETNLPSTLSTQLFGQGTLNTFRFFRFRPIATRNPRATGVQMGKIFLQKGGKPLDLSVATITNPMGSSPATGAFGPSSLLGTNYSTKWQDNSKSSIVLMFKEPVVPDAFSFMLAPDLPDMDPIRWKLEGSTNGIYWQSIQNQADTSQTDPSQDRKIRQYLMPMFFFDRSIQPKIQTPLVPGAIQIPPKLLTDCVSQFSGGKVNIHPALSSTVLTAVRAYFAANRTGAISGRTQRMGEVYQYSQNPTTNTVNYMFAEQENNKQKFPRQVSFTIKATDQCLPVTVESFGNSSKTQNYSIGVAVPDPDITDMLVQIPEEITKSREAWDSENDKLPDGSSSFPNLCVSSNQPITDTDLATCTDPQNLTKDKCCAGPVY